MWIEAPTIAKKPSLRYEPGEMPMVLLIRSNHESNKHSDTHLLRLA